MFKRNQCDICGDCLSSCQWVKVSREEAQNQISLLIDGKPAPILEQCVTCFACNEICPNKANPFDLILEMQEKTNALRIPAETLSATEARYIFEGEAAPLENKSDRIMTVCVFGKSDADLIQGSLYDLPIVKGKPYFCWLLFMHMGQESVMKKHVGEFVKRLAQTEAKEIICFHDDCYAMLKVKAPEYGFDVPFRPIHLSEYLIEFVTKHKSNINPLDVNLAYQRPCASRLTPGKEKFVDQLFDLLGARRVKRRYDRMNALCCGGPKLILGKGSPKNEQVKNILDAKEHEARALVCLCPMCMHTLASTASETSMPLVFISDLLRIALGEIPPPW